MRSIIIAPSVLAADFSRLGDEIHAVEAAGADWIHCDIMDGHFVDNISFGPAVVKTVGSLTSLPLDVHLMIEHADHYVPRFVEAGETSITVHIEPEAHPRVAITLRQIRPAGFKVGLTLNPETDFALVEPHLGGIDLLLIMTVHPGFGGQSFRADQLEKVQRAAAWRAANNRELPIEFDGGINAETASRCRQAGANVFVAGTSVFRAPDYGAAIRELRG